MLVLNRTLVKVKCTHSVFTLQFSIEFVTAFHYELGDYLHRHPSNAIACSSYLLCNTKTITLTPISKIVETSLKVKFRKTVHFNRMVVSALIPLSIVKNILWQVRKERISGIAIGILQTSWTQSEELRQFQNELRFVPCKTTTHLKWL